MSIRKYTSLGILLSLTLSFSSAIAQAPTPGAFTIIDVEQVRQIAREHFADAKAAGRLNRDDEAKFQQALDSASNMQEVEKAWADLEATAQLAKSDHLSIEHLLIMFGKRIDALEKQKTLNKAEAKFYRDRIDGIKSVQRLFTSNGHKLDFWQFAVLAIDLSSVEERLTRALSRQSVYSENFDDLILRSDMYTARNDVCARQLATYKSFEVNPDGLLQAKDQMLTVLRDRANSRLQTQQVKAELYKRLLASTAYEADRKIPTEGEVDIALSEVQRLIDAGLKNGNLGQVEATRLQHELELCKAIKREYPGSKPGVDPYERELRGEEIRFIAEDLRFIQDWLARSLRQDSDTYAVRDQILTALRRTNLAYYSGRISREDALSVINKIYDTLRDDSDDKQLIVCRDLEGKLDMMISDYSWKPVDVAARDAELKNLIARLGMHQEVAADEKGRIDAALRDLPSTNNTQRIGASIVTGTELELLRKKVIAALKTQKANTAQAMQQ